MARLDGRIVRDLVSADGKGFLKGLGLWFLMAIPSTYTNTMVLKTFVDLCDLFSDCLCTDPSFTSEIVSTTTKSVESIYT